MSAQRARRAPENFDLTPTHVKQQRRNLAIVEAPERLRLRLLLASPQAHRGYLRLEPGHSERRVPPVPRGAA